MIYTNQLLETMPYLYTSLFCMNLINFHKWVYNLIVFLPCICLFDIYLAVRAIAHPDDIDTAWQGGGVAAHAQAAQIVVSLDAVVGHTAETLDAYRLGFADGKETRRQRRSANARRKHVDVPVPVFVDVHVINRSVLLVLGVVL